MGSSSRAEDQLRIALESSIKMWNFLRKHGLKNWEEVDESRGNALHIAAAEGNLPVCEFIVAQPNCNIDARNCNGSTALHHAALFGHTAVCHVLIRASAQMASQDNAGRTPYHCAAVQGHKETCDLLLQYGGPL